MAPYRCRASCADVPRIAPMRFKGMPLARAEAAVSCVRRGRASERTAGGWLTCWSAGTTRRRWNAVSSDGLRRAPALPLGESPCDRSRPDGPGDGLGGRQVAAGGRAVPAAGALGGARGALQAAEHEQRRGRLPRWRRDRAGPGAAGLSGWAAFTTRGPPTSPMWTRCWPIRPWSSPGSGTPANSPVTT